MDESFDTLKRRLLAVIAYLTFVFFMGTFGYVYLEGYTILEGAYMTAITMSTVGYGEVQPLSHIGWIFSIVLIIMGFAGVAFFGQVLVVGAFEGVWSGKMEARRLKRKLDALNDHFIVCGYGRVGTGAVQNLVEANAPFIVLDTDPEHNEIMKEKGYLFLKGDATNEEVLLQAGIKRAKGLLALLNSDPDNLFLVLTARELNPTLYIVSRANELSSEKKILRAGADKVVTPFISAGQQMATAVLGGAGVVSVMPTTEPIYNPPKWVLVEEDSEFVGKTTGEVTENWQQNILGLRRKHKDAILPAPDTKIRVGDRLFMVESIAKSADEDTADEKRVAIIEDNPTILGLYARLFKRHGFVPITADNGRDGLETILREKPIAAVIDFMLPVLSGIEICQQVRTDPANKDIRLILFTADEQKETRRRAMEAGADDVVVKSADASKIIDRVITMLEAYEATKTEPTSPTPPAPVSAPEPTASLLAAPAMTPEPEPAPPEPAPSAAANGNETAATGIPPEFEGVIELDEMMEMIGGDEELMIELFRSYAEERDSMMADIAAAVSERDGEAVRQSAHKLKGTLIYLAAKNAADLAYRLEVAGREGNMSEAPSLFEALSAEIAQVDALVATLLAA